MQLAAGAFAGVRDLSNVKVFGKGVARGNLFGRSRTIAEASAEALYQNGRIRLKLYAQINGNVLVNINSYITSRCYTRTASAPRYRYRVLGFTRSVYVYVTRISFSVGLNAYLDCNFRVEVCRNGASVDGSISLTPRVRAVPEGRVSVTYLVWKHGAHIIHYRALTVDSVVTLCSQQPEWESLLLGHSTINWNRLLQLTLALPLALVPQGSGTVLNSTTLGQEIMLRYTPGINYEV